MFTSKRQFTYAVALPSVTKFSHLIPQKVKTIHEKTSSLRGHSIICLGMPLCPATVIILGEIFGEFPVYTQMTDFKSCKVVWCQM